MGYGAKAGEMEPELSAFISKLGSGPLILCCGEESKALLLQPVNPTPSPLGRRWPETSV
ncbi:hypothetical protein [Chromobacterium sphagni]|uniref:hypothetical protein n=1 Tax=Chromobacterium sphagni TaxID=1903179 RepID=UPI0019D3888C|nr:hypothetical protein [Chromobacterium sphagni]